MTPDSTPNQAFNENKKSLIFVIAGLGACLACFIDLLRNSGTVINFQNKILINFLSVPQSIAGILTIITIALIGAALCFVYTPNSRLDALSRGLSVFTVFAFITPSNVSIDNQPDPVEKSSIIIGFIGEAYATSNTKNEFIYPIQPFEPNATIIDNKWISSCKPDYGGILGLGSFFNNTINICKIEYILPQNERVQITDHWDTNIRGHRYVEVIYLNKNTNNPEKGWIWSGQSPDFWMSVKPDNPKLFD